MTEWTTAAAILEHAGGSSPSEADTAWAELCAAAVSAGIDTRLGHPGDETEAPDEWAELTRAALTAGAYAYKARETPLGVMTFADLSGSAVRVARDAIATIAPIIDRYRSDFGIG